MNASDSEKLLNPSLSFQSQFLRTMSARGFIHQCTDFEGLDKVLSTEANTSAYLGFDATAKSLHVGSLLQIMVLRQLQKAGHKPVILIGSLNHYLFDTFSIYEIFHLKVVEQQKSGIQREKTNLANFYLRSKYKKISTA